MVVTTARFHSTRSPATGRPATIASSFAFSGSGVSRRANLIAAGSAISRRKNAVAAVSTGELRTIRGPKPEKKTPASATRRAFGSTRPSVAGIWTVFAALSAIAAEMSGT